MVRDFNNDGKLDFVTANVAGSGVTPSNGITVRLGNGDGTFGSLQSYATNNANPAVVTAGDLNGDGFLDLVVAHGNNPHNIVVMLNDGFGGFGTATNLSFGSDQQFVELADLNGDGRLDLLVSDVNDGYLSVLAGNGNGTFGAATQFLTGTGEQPRAIAVGDFDGSGGLDVVASVLNNSGFPNLSTLSLWLNNGTSFSSVAHTTVNVTAVNDAPTLTSVNTLAGGTEDTAYTITYAALAAAANEADVDNSSLSFRIESVLSGTLTKNGSAVIAGTTLVGAGEQLIWTPAGNAYGVLNAFTVKAWDGAAASSAAVQVQVNVAVVNEAPAAVADWVITNFGTGVAFEIPEWAIVANDTDAEGDALDVASTGNPSTLTILHNPGLGSDGNVTVTDTGTNDGSFEYTVEDAFAAGTSTLVTVDNNVTSFALLTARPNDHSIVISGNTSDTLVGQTHADILIGNGGDDTMRGAAGDDTLDGGLGTDVIDLSDASGPVNVTLEQSAGFVTLDLTAYGLGVDRYRNMEGLRGSDGNDTLGGSSGDDLLIGAAGDDQIAGNGGDDTYRFDLADDADTIGDFAGSDTINITGFPLGSFGFVRTNNDLVATFDGTTITVSDHYDGSAVESLKFGSAHTVYGAFTLINSAAYALTTGLTATGANNVIVGGGSDDAITGSGDVGANVNDNESDLLFGGGGNDTITDPGGSNNRNLFVGGAGNDTLTSLGNQSSSGDTYVFAMGDGADTISDAGGVSDRIFMANTGATFNTLRAYDDNPVSTAGNLVIVYDGGQITVQNFYGPGSNRIETIQFDGGSFLGYQLGSGDYILNNSDGAGTRTGAATNDLIAAEDGASNTLSGLAGNDLLFGGSLADTLDGGSESDLLVAGGGADILTGGAGADVLDGGAGNDTFNDNDTNTIVIGGADVDTWNATVSGTNATFAPGATLSSVEQLRLNLSTGVYTMTAGDDVGEGTGASGDVLTVSYGALGAASHVTHTLSGDGSGTIGDGTNSIAYTDIERLVISSGSGNDTLRVDMRITNGLHGGAGTDMLVVDGSTQTGTVTLNTFAPGGSDWNAGFGGAN